eukprot:6191094-Pleurochrysis_carterae.AAC.2
MARVAQRPLLIILERGARDATQRLSLSRSHARTRARAHARTHARTHARFKRPQKYKHTRACRLESGAALSMHEYRISDFETCCAQTLNSA